MSAYPKTNDPTLDDIMVSIRRIMGNEGTRQPAAQATPQTIPQTSKAASLPPYIGFDDEPLQVANDGGRHYPSAQRPASQRSQVEAASIYAPRKAQPLELRNPVMPIDTVDNTRALDPRGHVSDIEFAPSPSYTDTIRGSRNFPPSTIPKAVSGAQVLAKQGGKSSISFYDELLQPAKPLPYAAQSVQEERQEIAQNIERRLEENALGFSVRQNVEQGLLSEGTTNAIASSFDTLSSALPALDNVEDTVKELLQPMLKKWLDENLPSMVERLIREEIQRVSRRPR